MDKLEKFRRDIEPHVRSLFITALRLAGNRFDAEDLLQETLYKAYKNMDRLQDSSNLKGWLFTIMKNTYLNEMRARSRRDAPLLDERRVGLLQAEERDSENDISDEMQSALGALPEEARIILIACEVQGLDYQSIARSMDIPLGTVKSRIKRARESLKKLWMERLEKKQAE